MPELPEVETIRGALARTIVGKTIVDILVRDSRLRWPVDAGRLHQSGVGSRIARIGRRSKYLMIGLETGYTLVLHLGMSGRILLLAGEMPFEKHDHVIFYFDDGTELRFRDPRRFGMVDIIENGEVSTHPRFVALGPEPLDPRTTAAMLFERARGLHRPVKNLLMDSAFLVGVGNIYANEALFHARLHPAGPAGSLQLSDWEVLFSSIRKVLRNAIAAGGTTLNDFVNSDGETGYFQLSLAVYGREGEPCPGCGGAVERFVQTGRSTFYCPVCQSPR
jgi:formamidopyrimidine-DNA glycosylase